MQRRVSRVDHCVRCDGAAISGEELVVSESILRLLKPACYGPHLSLN
jgi:hypothetical protein